MVRHELAEGKTEKVQVYGVDEASFSCEVAAPETPGEFCFPPIATLITSAARLQLALLERCVTDLGERMRWRTPTPWRSSRPRPAV